MEAEEGWPRRHRTAGTRHSRANDQVARPCFGRERTQHVLAHHGHKENVPENGQREQIRFLVISVTA